MDKARTMIKVCELMLKVAEDIRSLADSISAVCSAVSEGMNASESVTVQEETKEEASFEKVRGVLAQKSHEGHTREVRELIHRYGGARLSDIDPSHYPDIIRDAEAM